MRNYRMHDPEAQCAALSLRIQKELHGILADAPRVGWEHHEGPVRAGLAKHFRFDFPVSHRVFATMRLIDGQEAELHLFVDGDAEVPAGLELVATMGWEPRAPFGMTRFQEGFDGEPRDVEPLNDDGKLLESVREVLRVEWERGDILVERPDALLEVVPGPPLIRASTLPRAAWLGFAQDFALSPFIRVADRIEELHRG
jgi:hypothetical protein